MYSRLKVFLLVRTTATGKTSKSQQLPDHLRLPSEYEKVIEVLRKRGEKSNLVLATNEVSPHSSF